MTRLSEFREYVRPRKNKWQRNATSQNIDFLKRPFSVHRQLLEKINNRIHLGKRAEKDIDIIDIEITDFEAAGNEEYNPNEMEEEEMNSKDEVTNEAGTEEVIEQEIVKMEEPSHSSELDTVKDNTEDREKAEEEISIK